MRGKHAALGWLVAVGLLGGCAPTTTTGSGGSGASPHPTATAFDGLAQVGALFAGPSDAGVHFCTASVVHSPAHDLVATAAHCLAGTGRDLTFVPMYHDGVAPYGSWAVGAVYVGARWLTAQDPQEDVALLRLDPQQWQGRARNVEDAVGADRLVTSRGFDVEARVVGYALGTGGRPITCTNRTHAEDGYPAFDCDGYVDGTSGSPWITDVAGTTQQGDLYGVIGGLHQGGCTPQVSYSSYFGAEVQALYDRAVEGGPGDVVPAAGSSGC